MTVLTKAQISAAEKAAPISFSEMMEKAGLAAAYAAFDLAPMGRFAVFCGSGNNGGDGFVAARELRAMGAEAVCFVFSDNFSELAREKKELFEAQNGIVSLITEDTDPASLLSSFSCAIDAIFGTGLSREPEGAVKKAICALNGSVPTLALDIPSGVECDSGRVLGCAVRATATIAFCAPKPCHFLYPGYSYTGKLTVADIGFEPPMGGIVSADGDMLRELFPPREPESHKGHYGRALLLCGSEGYTGAAALAASAAVRGGAGIVELCVPRSIYQIEACKLDECIVTPLDCLEDGTVALSAVPTLLEKAQKADCMLIGCGLGRGGETDEVVQELVKSAPTQLILDADGINALRGHIDLLTLAACTPILTPHDGELARLFGGQIPFDSEHCLARTAKCAAALGATLLRKGHRTVVSDRFGRLCINTSGNPGMARGGSGDLLAGLCAAFSAQGMDAFSAASAAAYVHGLAGDMAADEYGEVGMTPSDMLGMIPQVFKKVLGR